ncbi:hypothetical protein M7I_5533 [Glarea lozoyensis 74030]|uniref:Uncharacterized protein n=1 Tax=Glarea lozoyensis (strain ATCC 74030 / MF5533) TaxID=1104152 RepID=H0ES56_GLAL7|nr:hypothetical protein M7I_5533 [Glarea lozoyensis 74030]
MKSALDVLNEASDTYIHHLNIRQLATLDEHFYTSHSAHIIQTTHQHVDHITIFNLILHLTNSRHIITPISQFQNTLPITNISPITRDTI